MQDKLIKLIPPLFWVKIKKNRSKGKIAQILPTNSNGRAENKLVTERADAGGGGGGGGGGGPAGLDVDEEIVEV